ncbi:hypothetical protein BH11MYX3_BH11MYX3_39370 [soil metagenome]
MRSSLVLLTLLAAAACSKKGGDASSCKPLSVTADGKAISGLGHGLARLNKMGTDQSWEVDLFNHDKTTCEAYVNKKGRQVPDGEITVRAFAGGSGIMGKGVGVGVHTQGGVDASVVGAEPKAKGDKVTICVDHATFTPLVGEYKDKPVVVDGLFEGSYCGEMQF